MSRTVDALIARGLDTHLALNLYKAKETLGSLQQKSEHELAELGLLPTQIESILDSKRPSIPIERVHQLLYESRRACVICRGRNKSIVIHHIEPWAQSRSHSESNLVVLCIEHHGEVHTKRDLSMNISTDGLRAAKERWLKEVKAADAQRMTTSPAVIGQPCWDYINFGRLEPVLLEFGIEPSQCRGYNKLVREGVITPTGELAFDSNDRRWRLQYLNPGLMTAFMPYMTDRIRLLLEAAQWRELPAIWSRTGIGDLSDGTLFVDYGGYRFKSDTAIERGPGQVRNARRQADGIVVAGIIDAFDAISTSAHSQHLSGSHRSTALGFIRGTEREGTRLRVDVTFLAFGTGFGPWSMPNAFVAEKLAQRDAEVQTEFGDFFHRLGERAEPTD